MPLFCKYCGNKISINNPETCPFCGREFADSQNSKQDDDCIIINPDDILISKQQRGGGGFFDSFFGGSGFSVRSSGGGLFGGLFGDILGNFFGFDEGEDEEYCDFTEADEKFINPNLKIIDPKKMIVLGKNDLKKLKKQEDNNGKNSI